MARETDFLDLYRSLGLKPGCGLVEFKQAYRRRVAVLHPDRRPAGAHQTIAAERLQRLTALYGEAMEFQRRHGRLPGAAAPVRAPTVGATGGASPAAPTDLRQPSRSRALILLAVLVVALLLWFGLPQSPQQTPDTPPPAPPAQQRLASPSIPAAETGDPERGEVLERGMRTKVVRLIEGEPMMVNGEFWEYGPSWIRFEHGRVVDWYSSPLRPLKLATTRRPPDTLD